MKLCKIYARAWLILGVLALGMAPAAWARSRPETLGDLAARSRWTGIVRCVEASAVREGPGRMIFTVYRFERLVEVSGADAPATFTLRVAGGTADGLRVTIPDAPRFHAGESYLICLRPKHHGDGLLVSGAARGVLPARQDGEGRWEVAVPRRMAPAQNKAAAREVEGRSWIRLDDLKTVLVAGVEGGAQ